MNIKNRTDSASDGIDGGTGCNFILFFFLDCNIRKTYINMGLTFVDIFLSPIQIFSNLDSAYLNYIRKDEIICLNQYVSGSQRLEYMIIF